MKMLRFWFWFFRLADKKDDGSKSDDTLTIENEEAPPTTFVVKNKYDYFKPRVEVETEEEGSKAHIKEVFIRGKLFAVLLVHRGKQSKICFPHEQSLSIILFLFYSKK